MKLSNQDIKTIQTYIAKVGNVPLERQASPDLILAEWYKNKKRLYRLLGNRLSITKRLPIMVTLKEKQHQAVPRNTWDFFMSLNPFYNAFQSFVFRLRWRHGWKDTEFGFSATTNVETKNDSQYPLECFVYWIIRYMMSQENLTSNLVHFSPHDLHLYFPPGVRPKRVVLHKEGKKDLVLSEGMKAIRALSKLNDFFEVASPADFNEFRELHSKLLTNSKIKTSVDVTFSIHPMDYLTLSDNAENWSSCFSWGYNKEEAGCFRASPLDFMTSNNSLVCFVENPKRKMTFGDSSWNSKSWRLLVTVEKGIIVTGGQYPYVNDLAAKAIVNELQQMVKDKFNWKYTINKPQAFLDTARFKEQGFIDDDTTKYYYKKDKKAYLLYTRLAYNDYEGETNDHSFWCVRNVPKTTKFISIAGKAPCLSCGRPRLADSARFLNQAKTLICDACEMEASFEKEKDGAYEDFRNRQVVPLIMAKPGNIYEIVSINKTEVLMVLAEAN